MRFPTPNKPHITKDRNGWYVGYPYGLAIPTEHVEAARVFKDRLNEQGQAYEDYLAMIRHNAILSFWGRPNSA